MEYLFVTWEELERLVARLATAIRGCDFRPDLIVGVSRGGLAPTRILSDFLDVSDVLVLGVSFYEEIGKTGKEPRIIHPLEGGVSGKRVILLDDVSDTGGSLKVAKEHVLSLSPASLLVCTLHRKPWSKFDPDIYLEETSSWIIYPWEKLEAAAHLLDRASSQDELVGLLKGVGFSPADLDLLRGLGIPVSHLDPLRHEDDGS